MEDKNKEFKIEIEHLKRKYCSLILVLILYFTAGLVLTIISLLFVLNPYLLIVLWLILYVSFILILIYLFVSMKEFEPSDWNLE